MIAMAIGAVINIVLDPIFIVNLKMGVIGAAIATGIGLLISLLTYIIIFIKWLKSVNIAINRFIYSSCCY